MIHGLNHIAIAVPDLAAAQKFYEKMFNLTTQGPIDLPDHGVTIVFINLGNCKIELMSPLGVDSPLNSFLDKHPKGGIHHFCLETSSIENAQKHMALQNLKPLAPSKPGAHNTPVIFLSPKDCFGCLIELEQINTESFSNS